MRRIFLFLLLASEFASAQDQNPKAVLKGPTSIQVNDQLILSASGSISDGTVDLEVVSGPANLDLVSLYTKEGRLVYGMAFPDTPGTYRFACIAWGKQIDLKLRPPHDFAFWDVEVRPVSPNPTPPSPKPPTPNPDPPPPTPPKPNPIIEKYGLTTYTMQLVKNFKLDPQQKSAEARIISLCFSGTADGSANYSNPTAMVQATSTVYKGALGPSYNVWYPAVFAPLKQHLTELNTSGKLPSTMPAQIDAWKEIATGFSLGASQ